MAKNVIVNAFAFKENYGSSMQISKKADGEKEALYMKNIVVSLVSAKMHNPNDEVALVANLDIADPYKTQLESRGIRVIKVPFDRYEMPQKFPWALAFFKLKVLEYLANETEYEKILLIDTDTVTVKGFEDIWEEAEYGPLFCPVNHNYSHPERDKIRQDYKKLYPEDGGNLIHYGGEFICGKKDHIKTIMSYCSKIYDDMKATDFDVVDNIGDETLISIAALWYKRQGAIMECGPYLYRYWTEKRFYLTSTNYHYNQVCIWHLPSEKDRGIISAYNYYNKHSRLPDNEKLAVMMALPSYKRPLTYWSLKGRYIRYKSNKKK